MRLTKKERDIVYNKFNGHCAYCGVVLGKTWHADHVKPVIREGNKVLHPCHHNLENIWPACPPCNLDKSAMSLENWREWLVTHVRNLRKHAPYKNAIRFGLIQEIQKPVEFYFEKQHDK